jgi:Flp pilus assembly protein TadG
MMRNIPFRALRTDERGATVVEFALVFPVFAFLTMSALDIGYGLYMRSVVAGTVEAVARKAVVGGMTSAQVDTLIKTQIKRVVPASVRNNANTIQITKTSYYNFSNVGQPEKITGDTAPLGVYNVGDCYQDANRNNLYDTAGGTNGLGGADDVLYYQVVVTYPRVFPMAALAGWSANQTATVKTLVRNQPYGAQDTPPTRCN